MKQMSSRERVLAAARLIKTFLDMGLATFYHSCGSIVPVDRNLTLRPRDLWHPATPDLDSLDWPTDWPKTNQFFHDFVAFRSSQLGRVRQI